MSIEVKTVVILAGGKGERIGGEKHDLKINGRPMISMVTDTLEKVFDRIIISGKIEGTDDYTHIEDEISDKGPLGGIYSCLKNTKDPFLFFTACDMPFLNRDIIKVILNSPVGYDAYIPVISDNHEPLCAVYSHSCLPSLNEIVGGNHRIRELIDSVDAYFIEEEEFAKIENYRRGFFNVNTPEELKKARNLYK